MKLPMKLAAQLPSVAPLLQYRGFILSSVRREFHARYQHSVLGSAWALLVPLAMIFVYTVIFSGIMHARLRGHTSPFAYSIYLCAGLLTWGLFAEISTRAQTVFLENANLIKKVHFPRICLPTIVVLTALINFAIIFSLFTAFLVVSGGFPGWPFLGLLPPLALLVLLAISLGVVLGILNIFFRDVGPFFSVFLQFWFWLTPIVYPATIVPPFLRPILALNPLGTLVDAFHRVLVEGSWPDWGRLTFPLACDAALLLFALSLYRKRASEMVDEL